MRTVPRLFLAFLVGLAGPAHAERPAPKCCQKHPPVFRPKVIYTARPPARVNVDIVSWGVQREYQSHRPDPTRVTINGLPRAARARLRVQEPSLPIDLSPRRPKHDLKGKGPHHRPSSLRERVQAATNLRTVWHTESASPEIASGEIANTWQAPSKVLPVNQPYVLDWSHAARASGSEQRTIRGHVQGLPTESKRVSLGRHDSVLITKSGSLAPRYEGFIQRRNLLKTDAFRDGKQTFVKVKGVRAVPAGASYTVRNLQTGETVSGRATRFGSFNARVPVAANAEQQLELTIQLRDKTGLETTLTRSLGRVTFAHDKQVGREIAYRFVERAGRKLRTISANVKGETVGGARRPLARPEVTLRHQLIPGRAERGTMFNFYGAKNQTVLGLRHVSADTTVEMLQQVAPAQGQRPVWKSFGRATVRSAPGHDGRHEVRFDGAILGHTPVKLLVRRPGSRKTHVIHASMPHPGERPIGNYGSAEGVYRRVYTSWLRPETVSRTVAHHGPDGAVRVTVHGRHTAPASARVSIVNETTGAESRPTQMREAFTVGLRAEPGHGLALKVQFADGKVQTQRLGIVPDAVEPSYRPRTGLHFFPFTKNHIQ